MHFRLKFDNRYYKAGNIIGLYAGFLVFISVLYLIFFRAAFTYLYALFASILLTALYFTGKRTIEYGKNKIAF